VLYDRHLGVVVMRIFVTYAREDRAAVESLVDDLAALGHDVWFDKKLLGGQDWWDEILARIRSCDLYLFALSTRAVGSQPCQAELAYANVLRRPLLPVRVGSVSSNVLPPPLSHAHYVDYTDSSRRAGLALAAAISSMPPAPPLPDPLPPPPALPEPALHAAFAAVSSLTTLDRAAQLQLIDQLRHESRDPEQVRDVYDLLVKYRARPDTFADLRDQADDEMRRLWPQVSGAAAAAPATAAARQPQPQPQPRSPTPTPAAAPTGYAPPRSNAAPPPSQPGAKGPWSTGFVIGMIVLGLFCSVVPIIVGFTGLSTPARKNQAIALIVVGGALLLLGLLVGLASMSTTTTDGF
jgi:serine/threonine kinase PknH